MLEKPDREVVVLQPKCLCVSGLSISACGAITNSLTILRGSEGWAGTLGWQNQGENEKNNWKVRFDNGHSSEKQALNWY